MKKRILSIIIVAVMTICLLPQSVFAYDGIDIQPKKSTPTTISGYAYTFTVGDTVSLRFYGVGDSPEWSTAPSYTGTLPDGLSLVPEDSQFFPFFNIQGTVANATPQTLLAILSFTSNDNKTATRKITFTINKASPSISGSNTLSGAAGYMSQMTATATIANGYFGGATPNMELSATITDGTNTATATATATGENVSFNFPAAQLNNLTVGGPYDINVSAFSGNANNESFAVTKIGTFTVTDSYMATVTPDGKTFDSKTVGYSAIAPENFTIESTGTGALANLSVALDGTNGSSFTLDNAGTATSLDATGGTATSTTFTVKPNDNLPEGTYTANLKVNADNMTEITKTVSFTVQNITAAPVFKAATDTMTSSSDREAAFTLTTAPANTTYRVYDAATGGTALTDPTVSVNGTALTLTFAAAPTTNATYYISAQTTGEAERSRTAVTVNKYTPYSGGGTDYYTLTFNTNGGSSISSIRPSEYTTVDLSKYAPTREGYTFTGWYSDKDLTARITSIKLTKNTTIYAGWSWNNPFTDVKESDWFYEDVENVFGSDLMQGTSDATFRPYATTTRGMIVEILYRLEGEPTNTVANPFTDVASGKYYTNAITWAAENKIVGGYGNGDFGPDDAITREQLATILYNYAKYKGYDVSVGEDTNILSYNDAFDISEYAIPAMQWACGAGILQGDAGNLMPKDGATRAQAAAMLIRLLNAAKK